MLHRALKTLFVFILVTVVPLKSETTFNLNYYPLQVGNVWYYEIIMHGGGPEPIIAYTTIEVIGDTLMPNGSRYFILLQDSSNVFERIDTLSQEVYRYEPGSCTNDEYNIYSLRFDPDTTYDWLTCYESMYQITWHDSGFFCDGSAMYYYLDSFFPESVILEEGWGVVNRWWEDFAAYEQNLVYAKVNGRERGVSEVRESQSRVTTKHTLMQNYPNPFNNQTMIRFQTEKAGQVCLRLYNMTGQLVQQLTDQYLPAGNHQLKWDGSSCSSGVYILKLEVGDLFLSHKLLLVR